MKKSKKIVAVTLLRGEKENNYELGAELMMGEKKLGKKVVEIRLTEDKVEIILSNKEVIIFYGVPYVATSK